MEPVALLREDTREKEAYLCPRCKTIWAVEAFKSAKQCCLCLDCEAVIGPKRTLNGRCKSCETTYYREREQKAQEKAQKIPSSEYEGPVFTAGDDYFRDWSEYVEDYHDSKEEDAPALPPPAWACKTEKLMLDPYRVLEMATEDHYDGAADNLIDEKALIDFIQAWNEKQTVQTYYADYTRLVVPGPDDRASD